MGDEKRDIREDQVYDDLSGSKKYYNFGLFRKRAFAFYVMHFVLGLIVYFITLNTIPYYLGETFGLNNFQAANIKSWYPIGEVFGRVACLFLALIFSVHDILACSYAGLSISWLMVYCIKSISFIKYGYLLAGFFTGFYGGTLFAQPF